MLSVVQLTFHPRPALADGHSTGFHRKGPGGWASFKHGAALNSSIFSPERPQNLLNQYCSESQLWACHIHSVCSYEKSLYFIAL